MSSKDWKRSAFSRSTSESNMSARVFHPASNLLPPSPDLTSPSSRGFDFTKKSSAQSISRQNSTQPKNS